MRKPNYTGQNLPITHNTYHGGKLIRQEEGKMSLQPAEGRAKLLETLKQYELPNTLGKGALMLTQMGEVSSGLTVVYGMGWEGNAYTEVAWEEMAEIAHTLQDKDGKMPNIVTTPTSALSKSIASEMAQTGSFAALAEELAPTVNDIISNDSDQVAIIGNSWGARLATAMSPVIEDKNKISQVVLEDPPASCESLSITQIASSARLGEAVLHGPRYTKASIDDKAREAWGRLNEAEKIATSPLSAWLKSVWAMTKTEGFRTDLDATLDVLTLPESDCVAPVTLVIPELSKMRGKGDPEALMQTVSARYPKADLRLVEVGDSTHNVSVANPAYFGKILELGRK